ncbi:MAG: hypothetical protein ACK456_16010 [Pseudanabaenaceae cyanobacterium]|jgi:hypothetical protein
MFRNSIKLVVPALLCLSAVLVCLLLAEPAKALQNFITRYTSGYNSVLPAELSSQNSDLVGLEYLQMEPLVISSNEIMAAIRSADERVAVYPEDIAYTFPLRTNYPVKIRNGAEDDTSIPANQYVAIGFVNANGERRNFKVKMLKDMFGVELRNDGNLSTSSQTVLSSRKMEDSVLIADASGNLRQYIRNSRFTLLVKNKKTGKVSRLRVHPNALCRDALNGVLTENLNRLPLF